MFAITPAIAKSEIINEKVANSLTPNFLATKIFVKKLKNAAKKEIPAEIIELDRSFFKFNFLPK